jgi:F0F1-type ATP synthase epsilon subunit
VSDRLQLAILTPHETVVDEAVRGARVPTETGQVGLRPRGEPLLLVVEPGLILVETQAGRRFAATAGGLLEAGRERAVLYTPFAVASDRDDEVLDALDRALATPGGEIAARRQIGELEQRIVREIRQRPGAGPLGAEEGP